MKKTVICIFVVLFLVGAAFADTSTVPEYTQNPDAPYRLFKTQNNWIFLKLNTCNGKISLIQWSLDGNQLEYDINTVSLISAREEAIPGRFTLYATVNVYNFVMLDTYTGYAYQVQWSIDGSNDIVIPIN